jgi:hypothetical protein
MKTRMNADEFLSAITREEIKQVLMEQSQNDVAAMLADLLAGDSTLEGLRVGFLEQFGW